MYIKTFSTKVEIYLKELKCIFFHKVYNDFYESTVKLKAGVEIQFLRKNVR